MSAAPWSLLNRFVKERKMKLNSSEKIESEEKYKCEK
jgi:hypothetical protein